MFGEQDTSLSHVSLKTSFLASVPLPNSWSSLATRLPAPRACAPTVTDAGFWTICSFSVCCNSTTSWKPNLNPSSLFQIALGKIHWPLLLCEHLWFSLSLSPLIVVFCFLSSVRQGLTMQLRLDFNLLCIPGWPQTCSEPPASACQLLALQVCTTTPGSHLLFHTH